MITSDVENYLGYADGVMGPTMMADFRRQAERFGAEFVTDDVTRVDFSERPFRVYVGSDEHRAGLDHRRDGRKRTSARASVRADAAGRAESRTARPATARSSRQGRGGRGRRRLGDGGGVPHPLRQQGRDHPPARRVSRRRSWSTAQGEEREGRVRPERGRRRGARRGHGPRHRSPAARHRDRRGEIEQTVCSSPSVTTRRRRCSSTGSITTTRAIS